MMLLNNRLDGRMITDKGMSSIVGRIAYRQWSFIDKILWRSPFSINLTLAPDMA